jgi:hypothetical protein
MLNLESLPCGVLLDVSLFGVYLKIEIALKHRFENAKLLLLPFDV